MRKCFIASSNNSSNNLKNNSFAFTTLVSNTTTAININSKMATVINKSVGPIGYGLMGKSNSFDAYNLRNNNFTDTFSDRFHLAT